MNETTHPFSIQGKTAVVTGGVSGIGAAIARVFAENGANVWIIDCNQQAGEPAAAEIKSESTVQFLRGDVTNFNDMISAVERIHTESKQIDILVNNAGVGFVGDLLNTPEDEFDRLMDVNVKGVFNMTRAALPGMIEHGGGCIINIASIASLIAVKERFAYCATKGAVMMMTKSIAMDYVDKGVRCNCICPARVHTPFVDEYLKKNYPGREAEVFDTLSAYQPIGRMGAPDEVAHLALYLASDKGAFHTGDAFPLSGGTLMG
ncbi:MAG: SDR family oxidoreductase [Candidatus Hinthialibacter antarcticus]|nr:SDR family oxidoreductase [Candidatus Hinthialibacter antarcticus]